MSIRPELILGFVLGVLTLAFILAITLNDNLSEPTPIYIILPDTTRLHLNSFNWRCTIEGATLEERSYPGSRSI